MKRKKARQKVPRTKQRPHRALTLGTCPECGYRAVVIGAKCPMCLPCQRCGRKLMRCVCIEGE